MVLNMEAMVTGMSVEGYGIDVTFNSAFTISFTPKYASEFNLGDKVRINFEWLD